MPAYSEEEIIAGCRKKNRALQEHLYSIFESLILLGVFKSMEDAGNCNDDFNVAQMDVITRVQVLFKGGYSG